MVSCDPRLRIRVITIIVTAVTAAAVVAGAIAVGVVAGRGGLTGFTDTQSISLTQSTISVALRRLVTANENREFYDFNTTVTELRTDLVDQLQTSFPKTFQKLVLTGFSDPPVLYPLSRYLQAKASGDRLSAVFVNASVYFNQNYTGQEIGAAFNNFSAAITLRDLQSKPSTAEATFWKELSTFTDTRPVSSLPNGTDPIITPSPNVTFTTTTLTPTSTIITPVFSG